MKFRDQLEKLEACPESIEWVGNKTIEQAWKTCKNSDWMIWILNQTDLDLTYPLCDMAKRVLHLVPEDHRLVCSNAIRAARSRANQDELNTVSVAADAAYDRTFNDISHDAVRTAYFAASAVTDASCVAVYAARAAAEAALNAARNAASEAAGSSAYYDAYIKEQKKQCDILRKYLTIEKVKKAFNKLVS